MSKGTVETVILTADLILFRYHKVHTEILLIQRKKPPFEGAYALPGGKMDQDDANIDATAIRELREEVGVVLTPDQLELTGVYSENHRDPRQYDAHARYVSIACAAFLEDANINVTAGDDAASAAWFPVSRLSSMKLAFDHFDIIRHAYYCVTNVPHDKPLL